MPELRPLKKNTARRVFERLEERALLAADLPLNAIAQWSGEFETKYRPPMAQLKVSSDLFDMPNGQVSIRLNVSADNGSSFDAGVPRLTNAAGEQVAPRGADANVGEGTDSFAVFSLSEGTYDLEVTNEFAWRGDFQLTASLVGDVDGDQDVDDLDMLELRDLIRARSYSPIADVNQDGRLTSFDYVQLRRNSGAEVKFTPFANSAPAVGDDHYDVSGLRSFVADSVFANDSSTDFLDALSMSVASETAKGARAYIDSDGNLVYLPDSSPQLSSLGRGESATDSLTYTVTDAQGESSTATISFSVTGSLSRDDFYAIDEDTVLDVAAADGVLANDNNGQVDGLRVVESSTRSDMGASVQVNADGSFQYDPTGSEQLGALHPHTSAGDRFRYTVQDADGNQSEAWVGIAVTGRADGAHDTATTSEDLDLVLSLADLLANDGAGSTFVDADTISDQGVPVTVAPGQLTYSPVLVNEVQWARPGEQFGDFFEYRYADAAGNQHTARVAVTVQGAQDIPVATPDSALFTANEVSTFDVLANDNDLDQEELPTLADVDATSQLGAALSITADGLVKYDPTAVPELANLPRGHYLFDSFQYRLQTIDGAPEVSYTAIVDINVVGGSHAPTVDSVSYVANEDKTLNVTASRGLLSTAEDIDFEALAVVPGAVQTELGFSVQIESDGSFVYDAVEPEPNELRFGEFYQDSFPYTVSDGHGGTVTGRAEVEVYGVLSTGDDLYETLATEFLTIEAPGVFENDPGTDLKLVGHELETQLGGFLGMLPDGTLEYDASEIPAEVLADAVDRSPVPGFAIDRFTYFYTSGDDPTEFEATVNILIAESADALAAGPSFDFLVTSEPLASQGFVPLRTGNFTHEQLGADGSLMVSLDGSRSTLTVTGPSGYGFKMSGPANTWSVRNPGGAEEFVATRTFNIESALGNLPIPATSFAGFSISTSSDGVPNVGPVTQVNLNAFGFSTSTGSLASLKDTFGIDLNAVGLGSGGQGAAWGLALGSDLKSRLSPAPPVQDAIPYFYYQSSLGNNLLTLGDKAIGASAAGDVTVVFDPADPMLFVKGSAVGNSFGVGGSVNGRIPFALSEGDTPIGNRFFMRPNANNNNKREYFFDAHAWIEGKISSGKYPFSVEGNVAINLDANRDGRLVGNIGRDLDDLFEGRKSVADVFSNFSDVQVGGFGKVNIEASFASGFLGATIPIARGAALWANDTASFRGGTVNPLADTPLKFYELGSTTVDGFVRTNGDYRLQADIGAAKLFGYELAGGTAHLLISPQKVSLGAKMVTPVLDVGFGGTYFRQASPGQITGFQGIIPIVESVPAGSFIANGRAGKSLDFGPFHASMELQVLIYSFPDRFRFDGLAVAKGSLSLGICSLGASVVGKFSLSVNNSHVSISGSGNVSADACLFSFDVGFSFNNYGFTVDLPSPIPNLNVRF